MCPSFAIMKKNIEKKDKRKDNKKKPAFEDLKEKLKKCEGFKNEYLNGWQRAKADFLNYKKSETERIGEILKFSTEELIFKILPILDNFNLVEKKLPRELKDNEHIKGILQIKKQLKEILKNQGIEEIKTINEKFDPNFHEVIEEVKKEGCEAGIVVEEVRRGYILHNKVIRPAGVKVSK